MFYRVKSTLLAGAAALLMATPSLAQPARIPVNRMGGASASAALDSAAPASAAPVSPLDRLKAAALTHQQTARTVQDTLNVPYGLTLDAAGNLYAANLFGGVTVYNVKRQYQGAITANVSTPAAVGVNFEGNIFIANNSSGTITVYNPAWQLIGTIADPNLTFPTNLYIDQDDTIWALDSQGTVHAYLANYTALPTVATGGTALGPWGSNLTVWGISNGSGGYTEDVGNRGEMVRNNPSFPLYFPSGSPLAASETQDAFGQQYVTDFANNQVQIWSTNAEYMTGVINTPAAPAGVAVDTQRNRIYVALPTLNEIIIYSREAPYKQLAVIH